ncbi:hypothetical protein NSK_003157 [Nannochloropsis salina CCMP1776]|jgi:(p)ppGpp synthase/HD superfamily hydrolase|uniref:TGS domain-containing protein n=1 Tax=Nannochloropsis salina CCMP1776 TaxID=1027361 RepID=A0A4D9DAT8_9STRA|nr:hypothetical protein NSK_003157 [Nannochloropsis salina CCMP1776]|eukprot:TFJ85649.1 hypothetical protein NSK_003157 [Nannochloropsis salina CCMP1776]
MHAVAEMGLAAHWLYKDEQRRISGLSTAGSNSPSRGPGKSVSHYRTAWLTCLKDWQLDVNARDFVEAVRAEILGRRVSFFLKNGRIHDLPRGATLLDAGFKLHKQIGLHLRLAEVNGFPLASLDYVVQNGDVLYVVATRNAKPSPSWVREAHCRTTRGKIRTYFRSVEPGVAEDEGRRLVAAVVMQNAAVLQEKLGAVPTPEDLMRSVKAHTGYASLHEMYFQVALSVDYHETGAMLGRVLGLDAESAHALDLAPLMAASEGERSELLHPSRVRGEQEPLFLLSHNGRETFRLCPVCRPVDGDPLTGMRVWEEPHGEVTVVHRADKACPQLQAAEESTLGAVGGERSRLVQTRRVDVYPEKFNVDDDDGYFPVSLEVRARQQRLYVLSNLVASLEACEAMLLDVALGDFDGKTARQGTRDLVGGGRKGTEGRTVNGKGAEGDLVIRFLIGVHNLAHVERVLAGFRSVGGVLHAARSDLLGAALDPRPRVVREHDIHQCGITLEEHERGEANGEEEPGNRYDYAV